MRAVVQHIHKEAKKLDTLWLDKAEKVCYNNKAVERKVERARELRLSSQFIYLTKQLSYDIINELSLRETNLREDGKPNGILKIEQCTTSEQALEVQTEQVQFEPLRLSRRDRNKKREASERDVKR